MSDLFQLLHEDCTKVYMERHEFSVHGIFWHGTHELVSHKEGISPMGNFSESRYNNLVIVLSMFSVQGEV